MKKGRLNWHNLMMIACVIPIAIVAFGLLGNGSSLTNINTESLMTLGLLLICPLMHLFLMRGMNHGKSCDHDKEKTAQEADPK